jgi:hypothetical protein
VAQEVSRHRRKALADQGAVNVVPIIRDVQRAGGPLVDQRHQRFRLNKRHRPALGRRCHRSRQYIVIEGKEQRTVDVHCDKVITIDTSPVGTIDFNLTDIEKQFLLRVGKAAA